MPASSCDHLVQQTPLKTTMVANGKSCRDQSQAKGLCTDHAMFLLSCSKDCWWLCVKCMYASLPSAALQHFHSHIKGWGRSTLQDALLHAPALGFIIAWATQTHHIMSKEGDCGTRGVAGATTPWDQAAPVRNVAACHQVVGDAVNQQNPRRPRLERQGLLAMSSG
jgi:hypothetical protein